MKKILLLIILQFSVVLFAQNYWQPATSSLKKDNNERYYHLDIKSLHKKLISAETSKSDMLIDVPNLDGSMEQYKIQSFPVVDEALAKRYQLGSYTGISVKNPQKTIRFSISPNQFQSTVRNAGVLEFITPELNSNLYKVHPKTKKTNNGKPFECSTTEPKAQKTTMDKMFLEGNKKTNDGLFRLISSDKKYRTLRIAISVTGEYTNYFGGVDEALAQINATLTRVNSVFENDFGLHLIMIDAPELIFDDATTDPYSNAGNGGNTAWAMELQKTLTATVGEENYDLGHLFAASGGGGNASCIGCVCTSPELDENGIPTGTGKGSAYTSPADGIPMGDTFDIDFVAHELGHQVGANHTFSHALEYTGVQIEPGSGSTIMGYAGVTSANVQQHSDPYFSVASIDQVLKNLQKVTCDQELNIENNPPQIEALPTTYIPKGTAFILTAEASDAENNPITYSWEQNNNAQFYTVTKITGEEVYGPMIRTLPPTTENKRYIPKFSSVLDGKLTVAEDWESAPMNARILSFRVLVRDNNPNVGQAQISYEDMDIVVGEDGPFNIEKKQLYYTNLDTPLKWNVAKTNETPYNVNNVMIDYTADNGTTWHTLFTSTANDGEENVRFPEEFINKEIKIRISAIGNIFYTISEKALVVSTEPCSDKAVENLTIEVKNETAYIDWRTYENAKYVLRYKRKTDSNWTEVETENPNYELSGLLLIDEAMYELQVAQLCSGTRGNFSPSVEFMIPGKNYCTLVSENATLEYISNITVNEMVNNSLGKGYSDFTKDNDKVIYLKKGSTNNRLSITVTYPGEEDYYETLSAWIDFNRDGVMSEEERIVTDFIPDPSNGNVGSVTRNYTFNVPSDAFTGEQSLRMRVALRVGPSINSVPESSCFGTLKYTTDTKNTFRYGEVEDYKVIISEDTPPDGFKSTTRWVTGVNIPESTDKTEFTWQQGQGWYDVDKLEADLGLNGIDANMCWAAAASNMLHWWTFINKDNIAKYETVSGKPWRGPVEYNHSHSSDIYNKMRNGQSKSGGHTAQLLNLYLLGAQYYGYNYREEIEKEDLLKTKIENGEAGFAIPIMGEKPICLVKRYGSIRHIPLKKDVFNTAIKEAFTEKRAIGMSIPGHAMNIWGADFDENEEVTHLYIVDNNTNENKMLKIRIGYSGDNTYMPNSVGSMTIAINQLTTLDLGEDLWQKYFAGN